MLKEFTYQKNKNVEAEKRSVALVKDSEKFFEGIDLKYIPEKEKDEVEKYFDGFDVLRDFESQSKKDDDGFKRNDVLFKSAWNNAWRRFSKSKIVED